MDIPQSFVLYFLQNEKPKDTVGEVGPRINTGVNIIVR
jgi:hypothetical protein